MVLGAGGCASSQKADLPTDTDAQTKLSELRARLDADQTKQYDALSPDNFNEASKDLDQAQVDIQKGEGHRDVVNDESYVQARLDKLERIGTQGEANLDSVLAARREAVDAGARKATPTDLASADETLHGYGRDIEAGSFHPDVAEMSKLEGKYSAIELNAIKRTTLGNAYNTIQKAKDDRGAQKKAPQTLQYAEGKYDTALRAIEADRRDVSSYQPAVDDANLAARKLDFVLTTIGSSDASESSAVKIWDQKQQLADAEKYLEVSQARADTEKQQMAQYQTQAQTLQAQNDQYAQKAAVEAKIQKVKGEFAPGEADVLRDGDKIILRLKKIGFPSSRAELPSSSIPTLEKVKDMIAAVPSISKVEVQGHTDNIGLEERNQVLSQKRADAVKDFLVDEKSVPEGKIEAKGYGDEMPLTSNKTKEGRATNRRVDVVIDTSKS